MRILITRLAVIFAALLFLIPAAAQADPSFPKLTGRVVDDAHVLAPDQAQALTAKLEAFDQSTRQQVVVATIPDLQGYDIDDYGYQLGRAWGIGQKGANNGIVLIVAPNEHRVRIEVGYGLEGVLTDALSGKIIREQITPRFKAGDMAGGINAGVDEIIRVIQLPPEEQQKLVAQASQRHKANPGDIFKAIIIVIVILFFIMISAVRAVSRGGQRYRGGGSGISPIVVWTAGQVLNDGPRSRPRWGRCRCRRRDSAGRRAIRRGRPRS